MPGSERRHPLTTVVLCPSSPPTAEPTEAMPQPMAHKQAHTMRRVLARQ
jgi:hypothetical protein